jgi:folate-binding protein YgfZ
MSPVNWFRDSNWALLEVRGADRVDFLHRLTTNQLPTSEGPLVHNFFLSVNARVQAEFWVSNQNEYLALLTPTGQVDPLKECIDRYHFGEKINLSVPLGSLFVLAGPEVGEFSQVRTTFAPDPRYGDDCRWCFVEENRVDSFQEALKKAGPEMSHEESELRRIASGSPLYGTDYTEDSLFVEIAQRGDFSETKGCYPGQEIVARVLHRGRLNRHLRGFESDSIIPNDWSLRVEGKEVAAVRSVVATPGGKSVGYLHVRREHGTTGATLTGVDGQGTEFTLTVVPRTGEVLTGEE